MNQDGKEDRKVGQTNMTMQEYLVKLTDAYAVTVESANNQRKELIETLDAFASACNGVGSAARFLNVDFRHRNYHQYQHEELLCLARAATKVLELGAEMYKE